MHGTRAKIEITFYCVAVYIRQLIFYNSTKNRFW